MTGWPGAPTSLPLTATPSGDDPHAWLARIAPDLSAATPAPHHQRFWAHVWAIRDGQRARPYALILARGGAKSTSAELAVVALFARGVRHYCWYVSRTQDQADQHVQSIAERLESPEIALHHPALGERMVTKYGYSAGWRVNRLRTASGATTDAIGLDKASRGRRVGNQRPDLIIFDDVDEAADTGDAVETILDNLRLKILPAGLGHTAVIAVQNLISARGVFARLADGTAGILDDAIVDGPHPALLPLPGRADIFDPETGEVDGVPTWEGQDLAACRGLIATIGLPAFLVECQHQVATAGRAFAMLRQNVHLVEPPPLSTAWTFWGALDYGYDHPLAFGLFGRAPDGDLWLLADYVAHERLLRDVAADLDALLAEFGLTRASLRARVAGHDLFARGRSADARTLADGFADLGWIFTPATVDRVTGWATLRGLLTPPSTDRAPRLRLAARCSETYTCLERLARDPKRPEDVQKVNARNGVGGDDPADMFRYGVMAEPPLEELPTHLVYDDPVRISPY